MQSAPSEESWRDSQTGTDLHYRLWLPEKPRGTLLILHGFAEHSGRYTHVMRAFAESGLRVLAPDLPGHGKSSGKRGHIPSMDALIELLRRWYADVLQSRAGEQLIFGHSFGGLLAIRWCETRMGDWRGAIFESPYLKVGFRIPAWKKLLGHLVAIGYPALGLPINLDARLLSGDSGVAEAYRSDPLVHNTITVGTHLDIERIQAHTLSDVHSLPPAAIALGQEDAIVSSETTRQWAGALQSPHTVRLFDGGHHELHNEIEPIRNLFLNHVVASTREANE